MWAHVVRRHLWRSAGGAQEIREVRAGEAHEAALEDLPGPVDSRRRCRTGAFATLVEKAGVIDKAVEKVRAVHKAVEKVGAVTDGAVEKVGAVHKAVEK